MEIAQIFINGIAVTYYLLVGIMAFLSFFTIYILVRYGRTVPLTLAVGLLYIFFFVTILSQSYKILQLL